MDAVQRTLAAMSQSSLMNGNTGVELDGFPAAYEQLTKTVPSDDLYTDLKQPDSDLQKTINDFLTKYETLQHRTGAIQGDPAMPLLQQPVGALASNAIQTVVDLTQELTSTPNLTFAKALAAITKPERAAYVGLVLCALGIVLVLLDTEA